MSARQQSSSAAAVSKPLTRSDDDEDGSDDDDADDGEDDFDCDDDDDFDDMDSDVAHDPNAQWMYHVWVWMGSAYVMEAAFEGDTRLFADTCAHELGTRGGSQRYQTIEEQAESAVLEADLGSLQSSNQNQGLDDLRVVFCSRE